MAKKSFKENPALQFISNAEDTHNTDYALNTEDTSNIHNTHDKHNTQQERKTKRLNLLLQPSMLEDLSKIAYMKKTSINDLINSVLKEYTATESASIIKYNEVFEK